MLILQKRKRVGRIIAALGFSILVHGLQLCNTHLIWNAGSDLLCTQNIWSIGRTVTVNYQMLFSVSGHVLRRHNIFDETDAASVIAFCVK